MAKNVAAGESGFTGGAFENFFRSWVVGFVSVITLSLAYPAMRCWKLRWECDNTYYDGKRLVFDGKGGQLFGLYIKWLLLSVITLGIYYSGKRSTRTLSARRTWIRSSTVNGISFWA